MKQTLREFKDVVTFDHSRVKEVKIIDASPLVAAYQSPFYNALRDLLTLEIVVSIATNPDSEVLFWEFMDTTLDANTDDRMITTLSNVFEVFREDLWHKYLSLYIPESEVESYNYAVHLSNGSIWICITV